MQPSLKKIDSISSGIFQVNKVDERNFYPLWHFHPQCEIMIIEEGAGTLYFGDGIDHFKSGDVFILGSSIPHLLRNYPEYFKPGSELRVKATVIYFNENFLGDEFLNSDEILPIKKLFKKARNGMVISDGAKGKIKELLYATIERKGFERMISFITFLNFIATKADYKELSSPGFRLTFDDKEVNRLNEIRIGYACKILIEKKHINVSQICYRTGFNNLTNFCIQFKKIKKCSPSEYRAKYQFNNNDCLIEMT